MFLVLLLLLPAVTNAALSAVCLGDCQRLEGCVSLTARTLRTGMPFSHCSQGTKRRIQRIWTCMNDVADGNLNYRGCPMEEAMLYPKLPPVFSRIVRRFTKSLKKVLCTRCPWIPLLQSCSIRYKDETESIEECDILGYLETSRKILTCLLQNVMTSGRCVELRDGFRDIARTWSVMFILKKSRHCLHGQGLSDLWMPYITEHLKWQDGPS